MGYSHLHLKPLNRDVGESHIGDPPILVLLKDDCANL